MNPRAGSKPAYSLSRGAPSASWVLLHTMPLEYDSIAAGGCQHKFSALKPHAVRKTGLYADFPLLKPHRVSRQTLTRKGEGGFQRAAMMTSSLRQVPGSPQCLHHVLHFRYSSKSSRSASARPPDFASPRACSTGTHSQPSTSQFGAAAFPLTVAA